MSQGKTSWGRKACGREIKKGKIEPFLVKKPDIGMESIEMESKSAWLEAIIVSPAVSTHGPSNIKPCAKNDQPKLIKEVTVPDSDIRVSVFKTHMAISQNETAPSGLINVIPGQCIALTPTMIVKLDMIRGNILGWINPTGKMCGESTSNTAYTYSLKRIWLPTFAYVSI